MADAVIGPAQLVDVDDIADLMEELDRFYGAVDVEPLPRRRAQIEAILFGQPPAAHVLLARDADQTLGMAAYSYLWPADGLTHSLYLKELYVRQTHRGRGIGRAIMQRLCVIAGEQGCSRVEWTTEHANADAVAFYAALGAEPNHEKAFFRLDAAAIQRLAGRTP